MYLRVYENIMKININQWRYISNVIKKDTFNITAEIIVICVEICIWKNCSKRYATRKIQFRWCISQSSRRSNTYRWARSITQTVYKVERYLLYLQSFVDDYNKIGLYNGLNTKVKHLIDVLIKNNNSKYNKITTNQGRKKIKEVRCDNNKYFH